MATIQQRDFEGLQVIGNGQATRFPDHDGMNYVPHSDKQAVYSSDKEASHNYGQGYVPPTRVESKRYCGLSKKISIIVVVAILCVVVGAAVGAGVGVSSANKKSNIESSTSQSSTSSGASAALSTSATSAPITISSSSITTRASGTAASASISSVSSSPTSTRASGTASSTSSSATPSGGLGAYNCPAQNATTYAPPLSPSTTFEILCDRDSVTGQVGINGGTVIDLNKGVLAYSIEACVDACVASTIAGYSCSAVTYGANVTSALSRGGITGNCFLKTQRARSPAVDNSGFVVMAFAN